MLFRSANAGRSSCYPYSFGHKLLLIKSGSLIDGFQLVSGEGGVGAVARFIYCLVRLTAAEEQAAQYKKRARNTVIFYIIAESIWQIKDLILYYYS